MQKCHWFLLSTISGDLWPFQAIKNDINDIMNNINDTVNDIMNDKNGDKIMNDTEQLCISQMAYLLFFLATFMFVAWILIDCFLETLEQFLKGWGVLVPLAHLQQLRVNR